MADALDPVVQRFVADTRAYVAGLEAGSLAADKFAKSALDAAGAARVLQGSIDGLHGTTIGIGVDAAGLTAAAMAAERLKTATDGMSATNLAAAAAAGKAAAAAARQGGVLRRLGAVEVPLFGGALKNIGVPAMLAAATGTHLLVDGVIELAGVVVPAGIAFGAFALAAAPAVQNIYTQMKNLLTVSTATGQAIYPLTGTFSAVAAAVQPKVYQLFGDALLIAGHNTGTFAHLATSAGTALDVLGARFAVAVTQGHGLGGILAHASSDLLGLGTVAGNVGGILGNFMKVVPGYAEALLSLAAGVTHVAEAFTGWGPVQFALGALLKLHGAFLYAGVAVTAFARLIPAALTGVSGFALKAATAAEGSRLLGGAAETASAGMFGFAMNAEKAAGLPWGWILMAAAGIGVLVYAIASAKDATQQWFAGLEKTIGAANAIQGMTDILSAQAQVAYRLSDAQRTLARTSQTVTQVNLHTGQAMQLVNPVYQQAQRDVADLTAAQHILADQTSLYNYRVGLLSQQLGGMRVATGLLAAAGVPMSLMLTKTHAALAQILAMVTATSDAYRAMGQTGGVLGYDMGVLNYLASNQYQAMSKLNQALSTYLGLSTSIEGGMAGLIQGMRQLRTQSHAAGASFTGVNNASLTLQTTFEQNITTLQSLVGGMKTAHASTHSLANVISTSLKPAVDRGALANMGMRQQVYDLARQAGYTGPDAIKPLTKWIDGMSTSLHHAAREASNAAAAIAGLHSKKIVITIDTVINGALANGTGSLTNPQGKLGGPGGSAGVLPGSGAVPRGAAMAGGGVTVNAPVTVHAGSGVNTQALQQHVQGAILDYFTRNPGTGLLPLGRR